MIPTAVMRALFATIMNECRLLIKDKSGLAIILLMPAALLLVMSVVEESAWRINNQAEIRVLFLDEDNGRVGKGMARALDEMKIFQLEAAKPGTSRAQLEEAVARGDYQVGIVAPPSASQKADDAAAGFMSAFLPALGTDGISGRTERKPPGEILVYLDPLLQPAFRSALVSSLRLFLARMEQEIILGSLSAEFGQPSGTGGSGDHGPRDLLVLKQQVPTHASSRLIPNAVQHNVPAWMLFGMFFIVVPLSGSMINERNLGVWGRLMTMPVSPWTLLAGKIVFYLIVCLVQMALMLLLGVFVLPFLGLPALQLGDHPGTVFLLGATSGLAAVGFGLLTGSFWSKQAPAAMFGAIFIVIMAAIGGLMVPVFLMPKALQTLAELSPLGWGLEAFHGVFARGMGLKEILPKLMLLTTFFAAGTVSSILALKKQARR